ncbi:MAG: hypothetical protein IJG35_10925 [Bacteroidales bacterium]|nr:hypothetical protein [Bacteroidales bacterium]
MEELQNNVPAIAQDNTDELEIDWIGIFSKLLKHWKQIFLISFIFGVLGIVSALTMTRKYNVTMTLAPEIANRTNSSLSSITSMLGLNGVALNPGTDAMSITLFPEICQSTPFLAALLDVPLTSYVSEKQQEEGVQPIQTTVYKHFSGEDKEKKGLSKWLESLKKEKDEKPYTGVVDATELPSKQAMVVKALGNSISAVVDKKTGVTSISVTMDDRMMAKQLADTVCTRLQKYVSEYRTKKAKADYEYYVSLAQEARETQIKAQAAYARSVDYDRSVILQSKNSEKERLRADANLASDIYSQLAQQRELARAKIQEEKPVYAVVQPATLPQHAMNSRVKRVLIWGFIGVFLSLAWYGFGEDFYKKMRAGIKEEMDK